MDPAEQSEIRHELEDAARRYREFRTAQRDLNAAIRRAYRAKWRQFQILDAIGQVKNREQVRQQFRAVDAERAKEEEG